MGAGSLLCCKSDVVRIHWFADLPRHNSPCDVLVMMSRYFPSFVAKASVATTPLVAAISKYMDCVFVDIKSRVESGKGLVRATRWGLLWLGGGGAVCAAARRACGQRRVPPIVGQALP